MMRRLMVVSLGLAVAACGAKRDLKSPEGRPPPLPAAASAPKTFNDMITPPAQANPDRVNEPLLKSEPRPDDRFDLPPPG